MRVFLFVPCYIDQLFPNVAESTVKVLRHFGCDVIFPEEQTCCGQPAYNSGYFDEARLMAMHEVSAFLRFKASLNGREIRFDMKHDYIVGPSGSCVAMMRNFYPSLLSEDPQFAEHIDEFVPRIFEFTEFINKVIKVDNFKGRLLRLRRDFGGREVVATYHDSCHSLRELEIKDEARNILRRIEGLKLVELPYNETCCGFGGTFAVKFPENLVCHG